MPNLQMLNAMRDWSQAIRNHGRLEVKAIF